MNGDSAALCKCHIFGSSSGRKDSIWFKPLDFWTINCRKTNMKTWSQTSQELDPPRIFVVPEFLASFLRSTWESLELRILQTNAPGNELLNEMDQLRIQATDPTFLTYAAMSTDKNATNYTAKKGKYGAEKKCSKRKKTQITFSIAPISYPIWIQSANLVTRKNRKPEFTGLRQDRLVRTCSRRGSTQGWAMSCHINVFKKPIPNEYFCIQVFWINFTPCAGQIDVKLTGTNQFGRA